jgi:hypothetical protein
MVYRKQHPEFTLKHTTRSWLCIGNIIGDAQDHKRPISFSQHSCRDQWAITALPSDQHYEPELPDGYPVRGTYFDFRAQCKSIHLSFPSKIWSGRKHLLLWVGCKLAAQIQRKPRISERVIWKFNVGVKVLNADRFGRNLASHVCV